MTQNVITPEFRGVWMQVFRAKPPKDEPEGKKKFQVRAAFDPAKADLSLMKKEAEAAAIEKWGSNVPKNLRSPFRTNDELDNPIAGIPDDWVIMTFSANEDRRPGVVDANLQDIIDEADVYSGAFYRAQVRAFGYEARGNKGVAFGLQNLQKLRDGETIGSGNIPASKAFDAVPSEGGTKTAGGMFD